MRKNKERTRFIRKRVLFFCWYEGYRGETAGGDWHGRHWSNRRLWDRTPPGGFVRRRRGQLLATQADVWCCRSAMSGRDFRYSPAGADLFHEGRDGKRTGGACGLMSGSQKKTLADKPGFRKKAYFAIRSCVLLPQHRSMRWQREDEAAGNLKKL